MIKSSNYLEEWALLIIICGALANIFDRSLNGFVIDFIYFHYKNFYWPAFNFADIYITIGIIMLVVNIIKKLILKNNEIFLAITIILQLLFILVLNLEKVLV